MLGDDATKQFSRCGGHLRVANALSSDKLPHCAIAKSASGELAPYSVLPPVAGTIQSPLSQVLMRTVRASADGSAPSARRRPQKTTVQSNLCRTHGIR